MVNKVIYQGRLTKKPEIKRTQSDIAKVLVTVAWSEKYKESEKKAFPLFRAWRQTAEFLEKYFDKGSEIVIEGHLLTENWGTDDEPQNTTFVEIDKVHFAGFGKKGIENTTPASNDFVNVPDTIKEELPFN